MKTLQIMQGTFYRGEHWQLFIEQLNINESECWAFVGSNGAGKSTLAQVFANELTAGKGSLTHQFDRPCQISFEKLSKLVADEWHRNNSDLFSEDENSAGRLTEQIILEENNDRQACLLWANQFGITHLLQQPFKQLSTGETRKALLCKTLINQPDLLILDEPFDGLDVTSRRALTEHLGQLHQQGLTIILIVNRFEDIPDYVTHMGVMASGEITAVGSYQQVMQDSIIAQLQQSEANSIATLPEADADYSAPQLASGTPCITLVNGRVAWGDKTIIEGLNWQVQQGEHWQIIGPNGAGKSTLLSLVTGDHPQGYSNDLTLFGRRRGSGETIWDIKQYIGYVSGSLHLEYRVSASVKNVILSGFYDSIGLYHTPTDKQLALTAQWLTLIGISPQQADQPFQSLSWGQQRLVLIVRALVKHPALLILDEPLQGLDALNRQLIRQFINKLIGLGKTQLLFVSHHAEDAPECITHRLSFVPQATGGYDYQQTPRVDAVGN